MFSGVPLVGVGGVGGKFIVKSTRRARNQNQRSNFEVSSGSLTHLKSSLGRTRLGRLLGGGGLAALSSLTSFASFAGLSTGMGTWKKEREERVGVGLVVMHHAAS